MNLRNVLKTYSLLRTLSDDETALLNTLRSLTETEVAITVEALTGKVGGVKKGSKKAAKSTKPKIPLCVACGYSESSIVHKREAGLNDYHPFQPSKSSSKSARASSLQQQIQSRTTEGNGKPALCMYEIDGNVCHGTENDGIHDSTMGYRNYHEFQPAQQVASASRG